MAKLSLNPLWPCLFFLFLIITTLHSEVPILLNFHLEALALAWALATGLLSFKSAPPSASDRHSLRTAFTLGGLFIAAPLITSLAASDYLAVLQDEEYKTLFKAVLFSPCLVFLMRQEEHREKVVNACIFFYGLFALYFFYRYLVLHEVRDFDQRPQLHIRHGDANFLCTFFSMMVPLPLMQAWRAHLAKKKTTMALFIFLAILLALAALATESRMGIISLLAGLVYLFTRPLFSFSRVWLIGALFIGLAIASVFGTHLIDRFTEIQDKSNSDRVLTFENGWKVFAANPIFGAGIHSAKLFFYQNAGYPDFQSESKPLEVHNTFLKTAAELGLVGTLFFLALFLWPWKKAWQSTFPERYFLLSSLVILTLSILTIGVTYKDLFVLHLFFIAALAVYPLSKMA